MRSDYHQAVDDAVLEGVQQRIARNGWSNLGRWNTAYLVETAGCVLLIDNEEILAYRGGYWDYSSCTASVDEGMLTLYVGDQDIIRSELVLKISEIPRAEISDLIRDKEMLLHEHDDLPPVRRNAA